FEFQAKSTVGDHYLYLPMFGVALAFAAVIARLHHPLAIAGAMAIMLALIVRSFRATEFWQDSRALFTHTLAVNPRSAIAENNLLVMALDENDLDDARRRAARLEEIAPDDPLTSDGVGRMLAMMRRYDEAADVYRRAIARWPHRIEGYRGLAAA